jgi:hypothetical protein
VTTRAPQVCELLEAHEVDCLSLEFAFQLFREGWARPQSVPEVAEELVVKSCSGLPLALLMVKGALRRCIDPLEWMVRERPDPCAHLMCAAMCFLWLTAASSLGLPNAQKAAHSLQSGDLDPHEAVFGVSESKLQATMQYSLHGVPGAAVGMFLDAACVLHGRAEVDALIAWVRWHGDLAAPYLKLLKTRSMVSVDGSGRLQVHDVLRWFGRRVVTGKGRGSADQGALQGSRLWVQDGNVTGGDAQVSS